MSDSEKSTTGEISAETEKGETLLFDTKHVVLTERYREGLGIYYQGLGQQTIPPTDTWPRERYVWVSVFVPEHAKTGPSTLNDEYRATYFSGTINDPAEYYSVSGSIDLTDVPSSANPLLAGNIEFKAETRDGEKSVNVTNGKFTFSGLTTRTPQTLDKE
ncbi:hypothetical protein [Pseudomonas protegens]